MRSGYRVVVEEGNSVDLASAIVQIVIGAVTGYYTNDIAVKMLFKRYGPLGGVVLKTREDFTVSMSRMIEQEVINHDTLGTELSSDRFIGALKDIVADTLGTRLYARMGASTLRDIPGIENTIGNAGRILDYEGRQAIRLLLDSVLPHIPADTVLTYDQLQAIVTKLVAVAAGILESSAMTREAIMGLYEEKKASHVSDLISPALIHALAASIIQSTKDLLVHLRSECGAEVDAALAVAYSELAIGELLSEAEDRMKRWTLPGLFGVGSERLSENLVEALLAFIESSEGRSAVTTIVSELLELMKSIDASLFDLLSPGARDGLKTLVLKELPSLLEGCVLWVRANQGRIESMVDGAVRESLSTRGGSSIGDIQRAVKSVIVEGFMKGSVTGASGIIGRFLEDIEEADPGRIDERVSEWLIGSIESRSIGSIVELLEQTEIISRDELIEMAISGIKTFVRRFAQQPIAKLVSSNTIGGIFQCDLVRSLPEEIRSSLIEAVRSKLLLRSEFTVLVQRGVSDAATRLENSSVSEVLSRERLEGALASLESALLGLLRADTGRVAEAVTGLVQGSLATKSASDLLGEEVVEALAQHLSAVLRGYVGRAIIGRMDEPISSYVDMITTSVDAPAILTRYTVDMVLANLPRILEGQVEQLVAGNLRDLTNEEMQAALETFMGKELRPITLIGGGLGAVAGLVLASLWGGVNGARWLNLLGSATAFGAVGYGTNALALRMIFRPYRELRIFGHRLPMTPGVVGRNIPRFAESMATFVDQRLLDAEVVERAFRSRRDDIQAGFIEAVVRDDYALVREIISEYSLQISEAAVGLALRQTRLRCPELAVELSRSLSMVRLDRAGAEGVASFLKAQAMASLAKAPDGIADGAANLAGQVLRSDRPVGELMPAPTRTVLRAGIARVVSRGIGELVELLRDESRVSLAVDRLAASLMRGSGRALGQSLGDLIPSWLRDVLQSQVSQSIVGRLRSETATDWIVSAVEGRLLSEITPDRTFGQFLDGALVSALRVNREAIASGMTSAVRSYLDSQRSSLKHMVTNAIRGSIDNERRTGGLAGWLMGGIKGLVYEGLDVYGTAEDVVDRLLDDKLPELFEEMGHDLGYLVDALIDRLASVPLGDLDLDLDPPTVRRLIGEAATGESAERFITGIVDRLIDWLLRIQLQDALRVLSPGQSGLSAADVPPVGSDLTSCDLTGCDLTRCDLTGCETGSNVTGPATSRASGSETGSATGSETRSETGSATGSETDSASDFETDSASDFETDSATDSETGSASGFETDSASGSESGPETGSMPNSAMGSASSFSSMFRCIRAIGGELAKIAPDLADRVESRREVLASAVTDVAMAYYDRVIAPTPMSSFAEPIRLEDLRGALVLIASTVASSPTIDHQLGRLLKGIAGELGGRRAGHLVDTAVLVSDLSTLLNALASNPGVKSDLVASSQRLVLLASSRLGEILEEDTARYLLSVVTDPILDSVEAHFLPLMHSVDIKGITKRQIEQMSPERIEQLFYSFAGPYLRRLELYGWWGGLLGLVAEWARLVVH